MEHWTSEKIDEALTGADPVPPMGRGVRHD